MGLSARKGCWRWRQTVKQWGNSLAFRIPKSVADQLNLKAEQEVDMVIHGNQLILTFKPDDNPSGVVSNAEARTVSQQESCSTENITDHFLFDLRGRTNSDRN